MLQITFTSFRAAGLCLLLSTGAAVAATMEPVKLTAEPLPLLPPLQQPVNETVIEKQPAVPLEVTPLTEAEREQIKDAVRTEIRALVNGDAEIGFAALSPAEKVDLVHPFFAALSLDLAPMRRAQRISFHGIEQDGINLYQRVAVMDDQNREWLARFQLQRHEDGVWYVTGCTLRPAPGQGA
jgi:hypothetical protein